MTAPLPTNAIVMDQVTKTFGPVTAVADLSLSVPTGCIYGFIGPNGSGKTTTLRMILQIFYPDQGHIEVLGQPAGQDRVLERIGYLPEERGLYRGMKVRESLMFYAALKGGRAAQKNIDPWLERFGMTAWAHRKLEALSKGMYQKVQLLTTIVTEPDLLILDEPFSGLDPVNANVIRDTLVDLKARGTTIILSTHDMNTAESMCDRILMIFQGRKVLDGTLEAIRNEYGRDVVHVRIGRGAQVTTDLPGVDRVADFGQRQELHLRRDGDPQVVLRHLLDRARVDQFEVAQPSLHDIFVRIAAPPTSEVTDGENTAHRQT